MEKWSRTIGLPNLSHSAVYKPYDLSTPLLLLLIFPREGCCGLASTMSLLLILSRAFTLFSLNLLLLSISLSFLNIEFSVWVRLRSVTVTLSILELHSYFLHILKVHVLAHLLHLSELFRSSAPAQEHRVKDEYVFLGFFRFPFPSFSLCFSVFLQAVSFPFEFSPFLLFSSVSSQHSHLRDESAIFRYFSFASSCKLTLLFLCLFFP